MTPFTGRSSSTACYWGCFPSNSMRTFIFLLACFFLTDAAAAPAIRRNALEGSHHS